MANNESTKLTEPSAGDVISAALVRSIETFHKNNPVATQLTSPAALHDTRVALRRLRSSLRTFRSVFDSGWSSSVRAEAGWFADLLGAVRQVDIVGERLSVHSEWGEALEATELVAQVLDDDRARFMHHLMNAGTNERYAMLLHHFDDATNQPPFSSKATTLASEVLPKMVDKCWRELRGAAKKALFTHNEVDLHSMRIRSKELRYAAQLCAPELHGSLSAVARAAAVVQDQLGNHRDALYTVQILQNLAERDHRIGFLAGQLVVHEKELAEQSLLVVASDFRRLKRQWKRTGIALSITRKPK